MNIIQDPGIIIVESEDPFSSILRCLTKNFESYIGFVFRKESSDSSLRGLTTSRKDGEMMCRLYETLSGLPAIGSQRDMSLQSLMKLKYIKRIHYYKYRGAFGSDSIELRHIQNFGRNTDEIDELKHYEKLLLCVTGLGDYSELKSGYHMVNDVVSSMSNISHHEYTRLISNSMFEHPLKIINKQYTGVCDIPNPRILILYKAFINLYTTHASFKQQFNKQTLKLDYVRSRTCGGSNGSEDYARSRTCGGSNRSEDYARSINNNDLKLSLEAMYLELTRINTCMHSDELILFDISKFIDTYNNIVEHSGVGVQIIDYSESKSQQAVVYNRGCMGTYTRTLDDTQIGIYKTGGDKIKVNSKLDGELILPLYGTDLGWLSTPDLENILEMVNSLSVSDTRFYNIQNHIIEILSGR